MPHKIILPLVALFVQFSCLIAADPWPRHLIDDSSRGADGVRFTEVDGEPWAAVPWEEGRVVRLYHQVAGDWKSVTVGTVGAPEDALLLNLNGQGDWAVVSACEGKTQQLFIHRPAAPDPEKWTESEWSTEPVEWSRGVQWMYTIAITLRGDAKPWLISGAKGNQARLVLWREGVEPIKLRAAGWIMSLIVLDMDGDGDEDLLFSDRRGVLSGVSWLEQPASPQTSPWTEHLIGVRGKEAMFIDAGDLDGDGNLEIVAGVKPDVVAVFSKTETGWSERTVTFPDGTGTAKSVAISDANGDGQNDLLITCEHSSEEKVGVFWIDGDQLYDDDKKLNDISGHNGTKFDRIELRDMDGDGDLDLVTCEERENLGVIWYECPGRP